MDGWCTSLPYVSAMAEPALLLHMNSMDKFEKDFPNGGILFQAAHILVV